MNISENVKYIGVNDHKLDLFEGQYAVPKGMSYNSYVILDEKIAVMDTVDIGFTEEWMENLDRELVGRKPDYLIVQHMEPDHSAGIPLFLKKYPEAKIAASPKTFEMIQQFLYGEENGAAAENDINIRKIPVKNGEMLSLGKHMLQFLFAPMVHWPEVIMTYEQSEKILFTADAFGKFGALDEDEEWLDEARRYYIGIVGKYGAQVQNVLKKAAELDIAAICPLHGPVLKENLAYYLDRYHTWSSYEPERKGIVIAYASIYGHTKTAALYLAEELRKQGQDEVILHDLARTDMAQAVADAFCFDRLVLACSTYNAGIFPFMEDYIHRLQERNFQNRRIALIENGSWAPMAARVIKGMLEKSKNITYVDSTVTIWSAMKEKDKEAMGNLVRELLRK